MAKVRENGVTVEARSNDGVVFMHRKGGLCGYRHAMPRVSLRGDKRSNIRARLEFGIK
jgi:hypothetical protein